MNSSDVILKAEGLHFYYEESGKDKPALDGLDLEIRRGSKVAFMGSNGSGKSTFFLCCNGILRPSSGTLWFNGAPVSYDRKGLLALRSKVGIVFQDPDNQLFSASVFQEISFGILNLGVPEEQAREEVEQVIEQLEITPYRHRPTHALSGGQKKAVSIADILVMHPDVIILDEPAAALDPRHTTMVNHIVDQLTDAGITVMMATHDVNYAYEWADEIVVFHQGKALLHGCPQEVFRQTELLRLTNLEPPAVLELFDKLQNQRKLPPSLSTPHSWQELESMLLEYLPSIS